jgi:hypothetical protein
MLARTSSTPARSHAARCTGDSGIRSFLFQTFWLRGGMATLGFADLPKTGPQRPLFHDVSWPSLGYFPRDIQCKKPPILLA